MHFSNEKYRKYCVVMLEKQLKKQNTVTFVVLGLIITDYIAGLPEITVLDPKPSKATRSFVAILKTELENKITLKYVDGKQNGDDALKDEPTIILCNAFSRLLTDFQNVMEAFDSHLYTRLYVIIIRCSDSQTVCQSSEILMQENMQEYMPRCKILDMVFNKDNNELVYNSPSTKSAIETLCSLTNTNKKRDRNHDEHASTGSIEEKGNNEEHLGQKNNETNSTNRNSSKLSENENDFFKV